MSCKTAHDGTVKEARMDVVVSRLGGRWLIDVLIVDGLSAAAVAQGGTAGAYQAGKQEKQSRYEGQAHTLAVKLTSGIAYSGLDLLENLSWEAAIAKPPRRLVRPWCRELELVVAFEAAEALRVAQSDS